MQKKDDDEDIEASRDLNQTKWTFSAKIFDSYNMSHMIWHIYCMTHIPLNAEPILNARFKLRWFRLERFDGSKHDKMQLESLWCSWKHPYDVGNIVQNWQGNRRLYAIVSNFILNFPNFKRFFPT